MARPAWHLWEWLHFPLGAQSNLNQQVFNGRRRQPKKFVFHFSGTVPSALSELEKDWLIIERTAGSMHFEHTSGGNGTTEVLKFTKL